MTQTEEGQPATTNRELAQQEVLRKQMQTKVVSTIISRLPELERANTANALLSHDRELCEQGLRTLLFTASAEELVQLGIATTRQPPHWWKVAVTSDEDPKEMKTTPTVDAVLTTNKIPMLGSAHAGIVDWYVAPSNFISAQRYLLPLATNKSAGASYRYVWVWTLEH